MQVSLHPGYVPHAHQLRGHNSNARFLCFAAGVRGGKSKGAGVEFVRRVYRDVQAGKGVRVTGRGRRRRPRLHYWVVAPIGDLLKEPIRYVFDALPPELIDVYYESDKSLWLKGDVLIEFKSAENPLHLVSVGLDGLWIDEAARLKADAWRGQLRQRLSDRRGWCLFSTTPLGRNWLYEDIVQKSGTERHPDYCTVAWRTRDNPAIPPEEIEAAQRELPDRYFKREYEASFDAFSGTIFEEWNPELHVVSEAELRRRYHCPAPRELRTLFRRVVAGVDWGWNAPGAIEVIGELGHGLFVVLDESYASNRLVFDSRDIEGTWAGEAWRLKRKWGIETFFADPARPDAIYDFTRAGLSCLPANNEIRFGVRKVAEVLHPQPSKVAHLPPQPRLVVLDTCKNLIHEAPNYVWAQTRDKSGFTELPAEGQSDHALDAVRYPIVELTTHEVPQNDNARGSTSYAVGGRR